MIDYTQRDARKNITGDAYWQTCATPVAVRIRHRSLSFASTEHGSGSGPTGEEQRGALWRFHTPSSGRPTSICNWTSIVPCGYEYVDGHAYALEGGSLNHSALCVKLGVLLYPQLRGTACRVYNSDARVRLSATRYVYPNLSISCAPQDQGGD